MLVLEMSQSRRHVVAFDAYARGEFLDLTADSIANMEF